jgi:NADP-reducing hydrogenase subunit HndB
MPKLTIDELRRKREEARRSLYLRDTAFKGKVIVHMGTCGIAAGARRIMAAVLEAVEAGRLPDIMVTTSGCAGLCSREPMMTVELAGAPPVRYGDLTPEKVQRIVTEHLGEGRLVAEYAIGTGSERGG